MGTFNKSISGNYIEVYSCKNDESFLSSCLVLLGFTSSVYAGFDNYFTSDSKTLLRNNGLYYQTLSRPTFEGRTKIEWQQASRDWGWGSSERYSMYTYKTSANRDVLVFTAPGVNAPSSFSTGGYSSGANELHFGYIFGDGENAATGQKVGAIFFVIHPNSWGPYQKRFATNDAMGLVQNIIGQAGGKAAEMLSSAAGAAVGTAVLPGVGTVVGMAVGAGVGLVTTNAVDRFSGQYLRYIG